MSDAPLHPDDRQSSGPAQTEPPAPPAPSTPPASEETHSWTFGQDKPAVVPEEPLPTCHTPHGPHKGVTFVFRRLTTTILWTGLALVGSSALAETTNSLSLSTSSLPDPWTSLLRVLGGLAVVLAVFLGGVWLFRNWQRLVVQKGRPPRLNVLEVRSLGGRHALYVVGYDQERFLIASSPAGVNFLSHLQSADPAGAESSASPSAPQPTFAQSLAKVLKGK